MTIRWLWRGPRGRQVRRGQDSRPSANLAGVIVLACLSGGGSCRGTAEVILDGVEFAGCDDVLADDSCVVAPGARLVIWLPVAHEAEVVAPPGAQQRHLRGGVQLILTNVDPQRPVAVFGRHANQRWRWQLSLKSAERHPDLHAAIDRLKAGNAEAASALVTRAWDHLDERQRALGLALRSEVAQTRGDDAQWFALRTEAAAQAVRAGALASAARHHLTLAHGHLTRRHDLTMARSHIDRGVSLGLAGVTAIRVDMQRGYLAERAGALAAALEHFSTSAVRAERLDQKLDAWLALRKRAAVLASIGRFDEALTQFRSLAKEAHDKPACDRAGFLSSVAWHEMMAREAGTAEKVVGPVVNTVALLDEALALYRGSCPTGAGQLPNVYTNLALARLQAGHIDLARAALAAARTPRRPPQIFVELWRLDLEGRAALAAGEAAAAREVYNQLEELAVRTLASAARWRAVVGRARAEAMLGHRSTAIAAYREAEALLDDQLDQVPLGEGQTDFLAARDIATGELMAALHAEGRLADAVETARLGRGRMLAGLHPQDRLLGLTPEQRQTWEAAAGAFLTARDQLERAVAQRWTLAGAELEAARSAEERVARDAQQAWTRALSAIKRARKGGASPPAPPPSGEVILGYHPIARSAGGSTSWMGYVLAGEAIEMVRLGVLDTAAPSHELAARLLRPFDGLIAEARRVRVFAYGPLGDVDLHALPYQGEAFGARRRIVYSLDLPPSGAIARPSASPAIAATERAALVVADPIGNLPAARREGEDVAALLRRRRPTVVSFLGSQAGRSGADLRALLPRADLFHYAGHGRFAAADGLGSELRLADGASLALADVLALAPRGAPRQVVLSGCETARTLNKAGANLGLAHAFVLAGSEAVVASVREVGDEVARRLSTHLHELDEDDLGEALRLTQLALSRDSPTADWAAFRVIVR
jgi:tetratricopeptide (TPR) repeat protein